MLTPIHPLVMPPVAYPPLALMEEEEIVTMDIPTRGLVAFEVSDDEVIEVHNESNQPFTAGVNAIEDRMFFFYAGLPLVSTLTRYPDNDLIKEMKIVVTEESNGKMRVDIQNEAGVSLIEGEPLYLN